MRLWVLEVLDGKGCTIRLLVFEAATRQEADRWADAFVDQSKFPDGAKVLQWEM